MLWIGAGARATLNSYGGKMEMIPQCHIEFVKSMRRTNWSGKPISKVTFEDLCRFMASALRSPEPSSDTESDVKTVHLDESVATG